MTGKILERWHLIFLICVITAGLYVSGCQLQPGAPNGVENRVHSDNTDQGDGKVPLTIYEYPYGSLKSAGTPDIVGLNIWWVEFVRNYITGAKNNSWPVSDACRVQRDSVTDYDTVSEGMGYGMLLAVYFNDRDAFDGLYKYVCLHTNSGGLMHWRVNKYGENISEFGLVVPHARVWSNIITSQVVAQENQPGGRGLPRWFWIPLCNYGRGLGSATDADVDIAAALCFAAKVWNSSFYSNEAVKMINNIMKYDMHTGVSNLDKGEDSPNFFLGNGFTAKSAYTEAGTWGGDDPDDKPCWFPSYFTPAWYPIFEEVTGDHRWSKLAAKIWNRLKLIDTVNNGTGLYPDAVDTSHGDVRRSCYADRIPYNQSSYNWYYDSFRVTWRHAVNYSWYGDMDSLKLVKNAAEFFNSKGAIENVKDGYFFDGTPFRLEYADSNNVNWAGNIEGGLWHSSSIAAMCSTAFIPYGDFDKATNWYNDVVVHKDAYDAPWGHYYGNSLRLLSLLYLSGRFVNLWKMPQPIPDFLERKAPQYVGSPDGGFRIDLSYANYGVVGVTYLSFNDRAMLLNYNGTRFADIQSGGLTQKGQGQTYLRQLTHVNNVYCGHDILNAAVARAYGQYVITRGRIETENNIWSFDGNCTLITNLGDRFSFCTDYKIDASKFKSGNNVNLEPGQSTNLNPGNYGDVTLKSRSVLNLKSGVYYFNSYLAEPDVTNTFDFSDGPTIIYVKNNFDMKSRTLMLDKDKNGADPSKILIVVNGSAYIAPAVTFRGSLIGWGKVNVDNANTDIVPVEPLDKTYSYKDKNGGTVFGMIWGVETTIHQDTKVFFTPFNWQAAIDKGYLVKQ